MTIEHLTNEDGFWYGGPLVLTRDESVTASLPHDFNYVTLSCNRCGRGHHEVSDGDSDPGCVPAVPHHIDYSEITRAMVGGA